MSRPLLLFLCAALVSAPVFAADFTTLEGSVVRLVNYTQRGDRATPWVASKVLQVSGSGFVIEGGLVMTNAHVVSDSRLLVMQVEGDPNPHEARIVHIAHDCDLALVRPLDSRALEGVAPLEFSGPPRLGSTVDTLGYPTGGIRVSSTRGVVSRIEDQLYVHSGVDAHLAVQTDAATNPGSSGGPVIQNGKVVGVAFQANLELESVGFFIPPEVIVRFREDVEDGRYDGYPELGIDTANMENPAARSLAGMGEVQTGVRAYRIYRGSSADGLIQLGDIVVEVNGRPVANDGSVVDGRSRIPFGLLIDRMFIGDSASIGVLRDGARVDVKVPLSRHAFYDSRRNAYDVKPRYFVYGGLVFVPLSRETLKTYAADWWRSAPKTLLEEFFHRVVLEPELQLQERVVLLRRLEDPVNSDLAYYRDQVVERVNGQPITRLEALVEALETHEGDYHLIEFSHGRRFGVLDRRKAEEANPAILERYGIQSDRHL